MLWVLWTVSTYLYTLFVFWGHAVDVSDALWIIRDFPHIPQPPLQFIPVTGMWVEVTGVLGVSEKPKWESLVLSSSAIDTLKTHIS